VSVVDTVEPQPDKRTSVGVAFAAAGALGALWAWRVLRNTYFFQDEWAMLRRGTLLSPFDSAKLPANGHLWLFQDVVYRIQALWFGLDSNRFVVVVFLGTLVTLHLTLAAFARRVGMPLVPALLFGALLTYLGPAAQNYIFAVQISATLAVAAAVGSATLILGSPVTAKRSTFVAALMLLSVLLYSGIGLVSLSFGGSLVVLLWPRRRWWVLAPAFLAMASWIAFAGTGPKFPASVGDRAAFALELTARSAGALAGGGPLIGVIVLVAFAAVVASHVRAGEMQGPDRAVTIGGAITAVTLIAAISQARAGIAVFSFYENNRYYQNVAIPLTLMMLPSVVGFARRVDSRRIRAAALPIVLVAAFLSGQNEARPYEELFVGRNDTVRNGVVDTVSLIASGCPSGQPPTPDTEVFGPLSLGVTTTLIAELARRELLSPAPQRVADAALVATICAP